MYKRIRMVDMIDVQHRRRHSQTTADVWTDPATTRAFEPDVGHERHVVKRGIDARGIRDGLDVVGHGGDLAFQRKPVGEKIPARKTKTGTGIEFYFAPRSHRPEKLL